MKITFSFGKNWIRYVKFVLNEKIIDSAIKSLTNNIPAKEFKDKIFLDIGSGSGLFSLCALRLGAKKIISVDIDPNSILATTLCKDKFATNAENWHILEGSILDEKFLNYIKSSISKDNVILYSWGVLHHTGGGYDAMRNCMNLLKNNDFVYIALYNKTEASNFWLKVKIFYNKTNIFLKFLMVVFYSLFLILEDFRKGRFKTAFYDETRGMYKIIDVIDWLGGLPYEAMNSDEVIDFWGAGGFKLIRFNPTKYYKPTYPQGFFYKYFVYLKQVGTGCNEFVFRNTNVPN